MKTQLYGLATILVIAANANSAAAQQAADVRHKVSTTLLDPRSYPDYSRRYVQPPTWDLFGGKTHFTTVRGFAREGDRLVRIGEDLDKFTGTKRLNLGDVVWPNSRFLSAGNIPELVDEMVKRDLYMYQIWGYVPGSGPGDWHQYKFDPEISKLFTEKFGEKWLGMDMGEQDGRYLMAYAEQMYPSSGDRFNQYLYFHNHMGRIADDMLNKMATITAVNYAHYLVKEGMYTLVGAEAAQMHPNNQVFYSFNRGAGKQYGVPWFGNASVYNRFGWKNYVDEGSDFGKTKGTSLSLLKRLLYSHILYNSMVVGFENGWTDKDGKLTPIGRLQQSGKEWVDKEGMPGVMQTPVAFMLDFNAGWIFPNYNHLLYRIWGNLPYESGDYMTHNLFDMFYPGYAESSYFHDERGFYTATPYGDVCDALLSDAPSWLLSHYPMLVVAGELEGSAEVNDNLEEYAAAGGKLYITAGSLAKLKNGLGGIKVVTGKTVYPSGSSVTLGGKSVTETEPFELLNLSYPSAAKVVATVAEQPAVVTVKSGLGEITVFASPFGVSTIPTTNEVIKRTIDKPLTNPFPMLAHMRGVMEEAFASQKMFDVGDELGYVICRRDGGEYTIGILNNELRELPFVIKSNIGDIEWVRELATDQSEKRAIGYMPEGFENAVLGKSGKGTISGGDVRIFRVKVKEHNVEAIEPLPAKSIATNRYLPIRSTSSLKEEILKRPTFFNHFDGVSVDWRYLADREKQAIEAESHWLGLQKCKIMVDFTSGVNLFPDLRLVNNIPQEYAKTMKTFEEVIDKMELLGAKELLLSLHREVENNISMEDTWRDFETAMREICRMAAAKGINVNLRTADIKMPRGIDQALSFVDKVAAPNLRLAPNTALLVHAKADPEKLASKLKGRVGLWIATAPEYDLTGRMWNSYGTLLNSPYASKVAEILAIDADAPVMIDSFFRDRDDEYYNAKGLTAIQADR